MRIVIGTLHGLSMVGLMASLAGCPLGKDKDKAESDAGATPAPATTTTPTKEPEATDAAPPKEDHPEVHCAKTFTQFYGPTANFCAIACTTDDDCKDGKECRGSAPFVKNRAAAPTNSKFCLVTKPVVVTCPAGKVAARDPAGVTVCNAPCTSNADCKTPGLICGRFDNGVQACTPGVAITPLPTIDAGAIIAAIDAGAKPGFVAPMVVPMLPGGTCIPGYGKMDSKAQNCHRICSSVADCPPNAFCVQAQEAKLCSATK